MTITSAGYPKINGNDGRIGSAQFSQEFELMGADYGVVGDAWRVSPVTTPGVARTVQLTLGRGYGRGIVDTVTDTAPTVQCATLTGASRWDTIVARRNWTTPATTFQALPGTATPAVSTSRHTAPGDEDDQVIALVKLESNTGFPTQVIDLRKWNGKTSFVNDLRAVVDADLGDEVVEANGARWRYLMVGGILTPTRVGSSARYQSSGTVIPGIAMTTDPVQPLATVDIHGWWHSFTTVSGRSELSDIVSYGFELSAVLNVQLTQIHRGGASIAPNGIAEYASSTAGLQVVYPNVVPSGVSASNERAFRYRVTGVL